MLPFEIFDIYSIASIYYMKGVVDAQKVYSSHVLDSVIDTPTPCMIIEGKKTNLDWDDYKIMVLSDMSKHQLMYFRSKIDLVDINQFQIEFLCLLDYIYKKGCNDSKKYGGANVQAILDSIQVRDNHYYTPEGKVNRYIWHDMIRKYLLELRALHNRISTKYLDEYLRIQILLSQKETENEKEYEQRRQIILSGGDLPNRRDEDD